MSKFDKTIFLENPIHKNYIPKNLVEDDDFMSTLLITIDGSIVGVSYDHVEPHLSSEESRMVRLGMRKPPDKMKIEDSDSFYKYISYQDITF